MGKRSLSLVLSLFGGAALVYVAVAAAVVGVAGRNLLLLTLVLPAAWLRVNLEPAGHLTLAPAVVITALVLAPPYLPVAIAALSAIVSALLFARMPLTRALEDAGEETIPVVLALLLTGALVSFPAGFLGRSLTQQLIAVLVYVLTRVALAAIRARLFDGIDVKMFLSSSGRVLASNAMLLSLIALGLSRLTSTYGSIGYFVLPLAIIALIETYHPFKLLS